jgi:hypothetical protein
MGKRSNGIEILGISKDGNRLKTDELIHEEEITQNQRLKNMFDLKPHLQLPGGYTFRQKKKLPPCSTLENL